MDIGKPFRDTNHEEANSIPNSLVRLAFFSIHNAVEFDLSFANGPSTLALLTASMIVVYVLAPRRS